MNKIANKIVKNVIGCNVVECSHCHGDGCDENMKTCSKCDGMGSYVK